MNPARPCRLVIDTNVALDLLVYRNPQALPILDAIERKQALWLTDPYTRAELARVLGYPELKLSLEAGREVMECHRALTTPSDEWPAHALPGPLPECRDPDDQPFLDLAARTRADLLISRDRMLLRLQRKTRLLLPDLAIVPPEPACQRLATWLSDRNT